MAPRGILGTWPAVDIIAMLHEPLGQGHEDLGRQALQLERHGGLEEQRGAQRVAGFASARVLQLYLDQPALHVEASRLLSKQLGWMPLHDRRRWLRRKALKPDFEEVGKHPALLRLA